MNLLTYCRCVHFVVNWQRVGSSVAELGVLCLKLLICKVRDDLASLLFVHLLLKHKLY